MAAPTTCMYYSDGDDALESDVKTLTRRHRDADPWDDDASDSDNEDVVGIADHVERTLATCAGLRPSW